eukprot:16795-Pelagomonas_calceolata.AAC.6
MERAKGEGRLVIIVATHDLSQKAKKDTERGKVERGTKENLLAEAGSGVPSYEKGTNRLACPFS